MARKPLRIFLSMIHKGDERTELVKRNVMYSFLLKGIGILISLLYVPITLHYLNATRYGIWMTLTSIVAWFGLFDIGLGNGLRNKLAMALATNDKEKASSYVSTTYAILTLIVIILLITFLTANVWIDWTRVLNTSQDYKKELSILTIVVFSAFCVKFVLQIIGTVLIADQRPALGGTFDVIGSGLGLLAIWGLTRLNSSSLLAFGLCVMVIPVLVLTAASVFFYRKRYVFLKPSLKKVDFSYGKDLAGIGAKFFLIQIAVVVIFQTSNILIAQLFSPADVTPYNIVFKYFSVLIMAWGILMTPLWSAFTHALAQKDYKWMKLTIIKLNKFMIITIFIIVVMSILARTIIDFWTIHQVSVSVLMVVVFAFYTTISIWNNIYANFLNGISQIKIQIYTSIAAALLHIPIAITLVKYVHMGPEGIVLSMTISLSFFAIAGPIQTIKILKNQN
jgi:O-antigen/teichoic acid export membrane protein